MGEGEVKSLHLFDPIPSLGFRVQKLEFKRITPYWRTLKSDGELNVKYPEGKELQKRLLEEEGHTIISKGTKNIKYYVKDFENSLIEL